MNFKKPIVVFLLFFLFLGLYGCIDTGGIYYKIDDVSNEASPETSPKISPKISPAEPLVTAEPILSPASAVEPSPDLSIDSILSNAENASCGIDTIDTCSGESL